MRKSIKVLVISSYRDAFHAVRPEGEMLIGLQRAGVEMEIMTQGDAEYAALFRKAGIRVIDFHPEKKFSWTAIRRIRAELQRGGHHILHLFNNRAIVNGNFAAWGLPVKVVTYRGVVGNIHWYDPSCYLTHLNPRVDKIIAVVDAVRDNLRKQVWYPKKIETVYKGQEVSWYEDVKPADLREFGIPKNSFVVASVANVRKWKGIRFLIESGGYLPADAPIHFLLIGKGMDSPDLLEMMRKSPLGGHFHVAGFRADAVNLVAACSVYVQPSYKKEGLGKTVLEAMCLGIPPIVTDEGGPKEYVEDGESGFVVPSKNAKAIGEAVEKIWRDESLRMKMGAAAKKQVAKKLSISQSVDQTKRIYEELGL